MKVLYIRLPIRSMPTWKRRWPRAMAPCGRKAIRKYRSSAFMAAGMWAFSAVLYALQMLRVYCSWICWLRTFSGTKPGLLFYTTIHIRRKKPFTWNWVILLLAFTTPSHIHFLHARRRAAMLLLCPPALQPYWYLRLLMAKKCLNYGSFWWKIGRAS